MTTEMTNAEARLLRLADTQTEGLASLLPPVGAAFLTGFRLGADAALMEPEKTLDLVDALDETTPLSTEEAEAMRSILFGADDADETPDDGTGEAGAAEVFGVSAA